MSTQNDSFEKPESAPITVPSAIVTISEIGAVNTMLDGVEFPSPERAQSWTRAQSGELLDALTVSRRGRIRTEVRESDGSVFTDIVHGAWREHLIADVPSSTTMRRARHLPTRQLIEVTGSGFIPGEDVTVALSVSSAEGSADGSARAVIDVSQLMNHRSEILFIGRVSGVIVTERLPS